MLMSRTTRRHRQRKKDPVQSSSSSCFLFPPSASPAPVPFHTPPAPPPPSFPSLPSRLQTPHHTTPGGRRQRRHCVLPCRQTSAPASGLHCRLQLRYSGDLLKSGPFSAPGSFVHLWLAGGFGHGGWLPRLGYIHFIRSFLSRRGRREGFRTDRPLLQDSIFCFAFSWSCALLSCLSRFIHSFLWQDVAPGFSFRRWSQEDNLARSSSL